MKNNLQFHALLCVVIAFIINFEIINAQTQLFQDAVISLPENINSFSWENYPENSKHSNGFMGWIRFEETPSQAIQDEFAANNYRLLAYYPDKVYLFDFPNNIDALFLKNRGVVSIIPLKNAQKMSKDLRLQQTPNWAIDQGDILVSFEYFDSFSAQDILSEISLMTKVRLIKDYKNSYTIDVAMPASEIENFTSKPYVRWIDFITPPSEKEDFRGKSLHRSSNLDTGNPSGRQYTGNGIGVMVRDDGVVGPHIDFHGRIDNSSTSTTGQTHGDGVAGILAGAGNLNPLNRGMAAGSDIYVVNYTSGFTDAPTLDRIANGDVQITNSSYGNGCNGGYSNLASRLDEQTNTYPELLHVFSAGNSGNSNCGYGAGFSCGTITGGHKQGKNVIATANTFYNGALASSSSRGPATDGRIKPDITAHGQGQISTDENNDYLSFSGTSGAAPGIAGTAAQLYQAYADLNGGALPESGLIKATLLNTANDYGNVGPDFRFGWGMVNGLRAAMLLEDNRFLSNTITQGVNANHSITIPANTQQVKIMLYWTDVEGASGASPALVNDLDLVVQDPSNTNYLPYILDPTPNPTTLNQPATNGVDRLNNMEQVVINNPAPGTYNIDVTGFNVPMGPQKYYVVYDIISEGITVTYPAGGETVVAASTDVIHWDGYNFSGNTTVEYSDDNGSTWNTVGTVGPTITNIDWNVPNSTSGEFLVRVTNNGNSAQSAANFSVAPRVTGVTFDSVCPTEATLSWDNIAGATSYDVYVLGTKYMDVVGTATTNSYTFPISNPMDDIWVAVSANGSTTNWKSLRTNALLYNGGGLLNCVLNTDVSVSTINNTSADFQPICDPTPAIISAQITNGGSSAVTNFSVSYQLNSNPIVQETYSATLNSGATDTYNFSTPLSGLQNGANTLRVWSNISGDEYVANDEQVFEFNAITTDTDLDFTQDFESTPTFPTSWVLDNPDNSITWVPQSLSVGSDGNPTSALYVNGANYSARGQLDTFTTEYFDLNFTGTPELNFDLAKAQWSSAYNDALRIEISTDCGTSFTEIYYKDGLTLSTLPNYITGTWVPTQANQWRNEVIDLSPYIGNTIILKFTNLNDYSNSTFIDNINLVKNETLSVTSNPLQGAVKIYPNPSYNEFNIDLNTSYDTSHSITITNMLGQVVYKQPKKSFNVTYNIKINVSSFQKGIYFVSVNVGDASIVKKLIKN